MSDADLGPDPDPGPEQEVAEQEPEPEQLQNIPPPPPLPSPVTVGEIDQSIDDDNESDDDDDFLLAEDTGLPIFPMPRPPGPINVSVGNSLSAGFSNRGRSRSVIFTDRSFRFVQTYLVSSFSQCENRGSQNWESGGKIILPPSALRQLSRNSNVLLSPMLFKATNQSNQKFTHCGVQEFVAEEDHCHMPTWMMKLIDVSDGDNIKIERVELPIATFAKFQPQSADFLETTNPKAILESSFRYFACLTKGDIIAIHYNSRIYELLVLELEPANAVSIIECDMNVDFAPPVDYVSPTHSEDGVEGSDITGFTPFQGKGNRLNGKVVEEDLTPKKKVFVRGMPDTNWKIGTLEFKRFPKQGPPSNQPPPSDTKRVNPFEGVGNSLKFHRQGSDQDPT